MAEALRRFVLSATLLFWLSGFHASWAVVPWNLPGYASSTDTPYAVDVHKGIAYAKGRTILGDKDLLLDAYLPTKLAGKSKAGILIIHGGSFLTGSRNDMASLCQSFARKGVAAFSMDYRMQGDTPAVSLPAQYPAIVRSMQAAYIDAKAAIRFLRAHAGEYGLDTSEIFIGGASAGAITALVAAATPSDMYVSDTAGKPIRPDNNPGQTMRVRAVVDWCGAMYNDLSQLDAKDPPIVVYHGEADPTVAYSYATDIQARCKTVGLECEFHSVPGGGHCPLAGSADGDFLPVATSFVMRHIAAAPVSVRVAGHVGSLHWGRQGTSSFWIEGPPERLRQAKLFDAKGRQIPVQSMVQSPDGWTVEFASRTPGLLFLKVQDEHGTSKTVTIPNLR